MHSPITVKIRKSPIPILWLDTSVLIYMTKWKFQIGGIPEKTTTERVQRLHDQIIEYTLKSKLICPLSDQPDEVWCERKKWLDLANSISFGIKTASEDTIEQKQLERLMKAYINSEKQIELSYEDAFLDDPIEELEWALKTGMIITVDHGILFGIEHNKAKNELLLKQLNHFREEVVRSEISFEDQLKREYKGKLTAMKILTGNAMLGKFRDEFEEMNSVAGYIALSRELKLLERYSGKGLDIKGLEAFYESEYYAAIPFCHLQSNIMAYLMTRQHPIVSGDSMDSKHIAMLLPYSDLFITDRRMSNFINIQGFDRLYNTKVCYIGDTEIIDSFFEGL
jgi:hypothetical protein